ncbi:MAG: hypothetical protein VB853_09665 [Pirellulales bacterium]
MFGSDIDQRIILAVMILQRSGQSDLQVIRHIPSRIGHSDAFDLPWKNISVYEFDVGSFPKYSFLTVSDQTDILVRLKDQLVIEMGIGSAMGKKMIHLNSGALDRPPVGIDHLVRQLMRRIALPRQRLLEATEEQYHRERNMKIESHIAFYSTQSLAAEQRHLHPYFESIAIAATLVGTLSPPRKDAEISVPEMVPQPEIRVVTL